MGSSPPRPWAHPIRGLEPLPTGPRSLHHALPPWLPRCAWDAGTGVGERKEGAARRLSPLGPSPSFAQAPSREAVGPGFGPSPAAKNSRPGLCGKPLGWGRKDQGLGLEWGGGRPGGKCPVPCPPPAKPGVSGHSPLESPRGCLQICRGQESPDLSGWASNFRVGFPCPADPSWAWAGHKEGGMKVVLSPSVIPCTDDLNCLTLQFSPFTIPTRTSQKIVTEGLLCWGTTQRKVFQGTNTQ